MKNIAKSAVKGALFTGSKAVGGIGLIPDAAVFVDGYYKVYKKGYTDYRPKKLILRKGGFNISVTKNVRFNARGSQIAGYYKENL